MQSTAAMAEKLSSGTNKRRNIIVSACAGFIIFGALIAVLLTSAKSQPSIIDEQFASVNAASAFSTSGSGTWQVTGGVYKLTQPESLASTAQENVSLSINTKKFSGNEWRFSTSARVLNTSTPHDVSLIFDYVDPLNYYYANFSDKTEQYSNGFFKVSEGKVTPLGAFSRTLPTDQNATLEIRKHGDGAKAYIGTTYVGKTTTKTSENVQVGYGSRGGSLVLDNLLLTAPDAKGNTGNGGNSGNTGNNGGGTSNPTPTPPANPGNGGNTSTPPVVTPTPGGRAIGVSTTDQLISALENAQPGDVITMGDGTYSGKLKPVAVGERTTNAKFRITKSGTAAKPIVLQGSRNAVINGKPGGIGTGGDYGLHLIGANYWQIKGIRVTNVGKGIMLDGSNNNLIDGVMVDTVGNEAVHFRTNSSNNTIRNSFITSTGHANMGYGEGLYIGTDAGSWKTLMGNDTNGQPIPDRSGNNTIEGNTITEFTAEGIDIKEASSKNVIRNNRFDGSKIGGTSKANSADSWVDVKGDNNLFEGNSGVNVLMFDKDSSAAFQTHEHGPSGYNSANDNIFRKNTINLNGPGYGFYLNGKRNIVTCDNTVTNAGHGFGATTDVTYADGTTKVTGGAYKLKCVQ